MYNWTDDEIYIAWWKWSLINTTQHQETMVSFRPIFNQYTPTVCAIQASPWHVKLSSSRQVPYFFNTETRESRWDAPPDLSQEQILALPGASEYLSASGQPKTVESAGQPGQVRASHLLVKHAGSRRPSSWKEVCKLVYITCINLTNDHIVHSLHFLCLSLYLIQQNITRSKAEAIAILKGYEATIDGDPAKFSAIAGQYSDCSSHSKNGDLGWFGKGQMQRPFEEATLALNVGQISGVVETDSGVHLIMRTGWDERRWMKQVNRRNVMCTRNSSSLRCILVRWGGQLMHPFGAGTWKQEVAVDRI